MDDATPARDDLAARREILTRHAKAKAVQLHAPSAGPEIAVIAFVLTVLVASAALLWGVVGLG